MPRKPKRSGGTDIGGLGPLFEGIDPDAPKPTPNQPLHTAAQDTASSPSTSAPLPQASSGLELNEESSHSPDDASADFQIGSDVSRDRASIGSDQPTVPVSGVGNPIFDRAVEILRNEGVGRAGTAGAMTSATASATDRRLPARILNEFVYCPRLFYYEHVEGVFVESADTIQGAAIHKRVDSGSGALPPADRSPASSATPPNSDGESAGTETIHSRSVMLGSDRLGVVAKLDLVEVEGIRDGREEGDICIARSVVPVDYKLGRPREGNDANELWPADQMQLGVQILVLRENGYSCNEGVIYYRATRQRVRFEMTPEREAWVLAQIESARVTMDGPMPPPLVGSPKCRRCSLAPVCLPDETHLLGRQSNTDDAKPSPVSSRSRNDGGHAAEDGEKSATTEKESPRRLMAARDDRRALYLNTPGLRVGRKDETLTVKDEDKLLDEVRLNDVSHVALFGNIQITTQAVQALCDAEIPVTYFSGGGWFYGITHGHGLKNVFLRIEQFRVARDPDTCLRMARAFVNGKIRNHRTLLMRNHSDAPSSALVRLKFAAEDALKATSLEELLGIEGAAAAAYFEHFQGMLRSGNPDDDEIPGLTTTNAKTKPLSFEFQARHRRPPTDPVNALLSLAYSVLSKDCTIAATAVGFDPYVGFYHQPRFGRPALALDLMEEFRPLVAESVVLTAINNRMVTPEDFVRAGQAVNLTPAGRKKFFMAYEQRMSSLLTHPLFDYKVSYRRALELQARILAKAITHEIPGYAPLLTR